MLLKQVHILRNRFVLALALVMFALLVQGQNNAVSVTVDADPRAICPGDTVHLHADAVASMIVDFETGDFSQAAFDTSGLSHPWVITTTNPYEGSFCMKSHCEGIHSASSSIEAVVDVPRTSIMSFFVRVSSESYYDKFHFYIDGVEYVNDLSGQVPYRNLRFRVDEGHHTYKWLYQKDGSVNTNDDCVYVDNIIMYQPMDFIPIVSIDFETGSIPQANFSNNSSYPWGIRNANNGSSYCMGSSNQGVHNSSSVITMSFYADKTTYISFDAKYMGEGTSYPYDKSIFYIDNVAQFTYGETDMSWHFYQSGAIPEGSHTLKWEYRKDYSVHPTGDAFLVDNILLYKEEPVGSGEDDDFDYHWEPVNMDNQDIVVSPNETTTYTVTASQNGTVMGSGQQTIVVYSNPNLTLTTNTGNTEICEGDTITIYATVDPVSDLLVGDILCDDGTFVHAAEWEPDNGKTAKGIVFYVDLTGVHGWAVGLEQTSAKWSTETVSVSGLQAFSHWMDAISDLDGYANTRAIRNKGNASEYPAAWAVDFDNGWYLPAIGQLNVLLGSLFVVNNSLEKVGGEAILYDSNSQYIWSSSTSTLPGYSAAFLPIYEQVEFVPKGSSFFVRKVIGF